MMMRPHLSALPRLPAAILLLLLGVCVGAAEDDDVPSLDRRADLVRAPFLLSRDSATGFLPPPSSSSDAGAGWVKTQTGSLVDQLECGARALDLHPAGRAGSLIFRGGAPDPTTAGSSSGEGSESSSVLIEKSFVDAMSEVLEWASSQPRDELILLLLRDCYGGDGGYDENESCDEAVDDVFWDLMVEQVTDCGQLSGMSVSDARERGVVVGNGGGASVLAVSARANSRDGEEDCVRDNRPVGLGCWGFKPGTDAAMADGVMDELERIVAPILAGTVADHVELGTILREADSFLDREVMDSIYGCWTDDATSSMPLGMLRRNLTATQEGGTGLDPGYYGTAGDGGGARLWQMQASWQVRPSRPSVVLGTIVPMIETGTPSSVLRDTTESDLNRILAEHYIPALSVEGPVNLFGVDDVCSHGAEMLSALRTEHVSAPPTRSPVGTEEDGGGTASAPTAAAAADDNAVDPTNAPTPAPKEDVPVPPDGTAIPTASPVALPPSKAEADDLPPAPSSSPPNEEDEEGAGMPTADPTTAPTTSVGTSGAGGALHGLLLLHVAHFVWSFWW